MKAIKFRKLRDEDPFKNEEGPLGHTYKKIGLTTSMHPFCRNTVNAEAIVLTPLDPPGGILVSADTMVFVDDALALARE